MESQTIKNKTSCSKQSSSTTKTPAVNQRSIPSPTTRIFARVSRPTTKSRWPVAALTPSPNSLPMQTRQDWLLSINTTSQRPKSTRQTNSVTTGRSSYLHSRACPTTWAAAPIRCTSVARLRSKRMARRNLLLCSRMKTDLSQRQDLQTTYTCRCNNSSRQTED